MKIIQLSKEEYMELMSKKPDFEGSEGNLYKKCGYLYKLYHNPYHYSEARLEQIISFQPFLQYTKLPIGALRFRKRFIGSILYDFQDATTFYSVYRQSLSIKIQKLKELSRNLRELTYQGLVLTDLFYGNVVIDQNGAPQLVDTDGDNVELLKENDQLIHLLRCFKDMIVGCCNTIEIPLSDERLSFAHLEYFLDEHSQSQKTLQ